MEHATRINNWYENLTSEDMPPQWMWPFEDELSSWFELVEIRRKERYGGDTDDDAAMTRNEWSPEDE